MKLLFDHHLSPTLVPRLADLFPGSDHVWHLALHELPDTDIWLYAREHDFTIVSKDADFSEISMQLGFPPKLVWLQIPNWTTGEIETLIRARYTQIAVCRTPPSEGFWCCSRSLGKAWSAGEDAGAPRLSALSPFSLLP